MTTKEFKKRWLVVLFSLTLFTLSPGWCRDIVDMSESFHKLQEPVILYDLGEKGFAAYDVGDDRKKRGGVSKSANFGIIFMLRYELIIDARLKSPKISNS